MKKIIIIISIFVLCGCGNPEDLTDAQIESVAKNCTALGLQVKVNKSHTANTVDCVSTIVKD